MTGRPIIIDCDPGQDDAINLLLALSSPDELDVLGITTVAGNVPLALTERNTRQICDIAGRQDVPVYAGCDRPMKRPLLTAEKVHGKTGIDGIDIVEPETPLQAGHAVDFIIETLSNAGTPVTLVPTGPLTNVGTAFEREPAIVERIDSIVLMGGAMREGGNHSRPACSTFSIVTIPPSTNPSARRCTTPARSPGCCGRTFSKADTAT